MPQSIPDFVYQLGRSVVDREKRGQHLQSGPLRSIGYSQHCLDTTGRRLNPQEHRTRHEFPFVAQWQSRVLIRLRRVFDSPRKDQPTKMRRTMQIQYKLERLAAAPHIAMDRLPERPKGSDF